MIVHIIEGLICQDCTVLEANGETPPHMSEDETAAWLESLSDGFTLGRLTENCDAPDGCAHHDTADDYTCEIIDFSYSRCASCGTTLGGYRHYVTYD